MTRCWIHVGRFAAWAVLLAPLVLSSADAWARVGGGQSFSSGGTSSGGGSDGGGSVEGELLCLILQLCIEYPAIGIPCLILFVIVMFLRAVFSGGKDRVRVGHDTAKSGPQVRWRPHPGIERLRAEDGAFSQPVLYDYVQLLHRRCHEALVAGDFSPLVAFAASTFVKELEEANPGVTDIGDVVLGAIRVEDVKFGAKEVLLVIDLENTRVETRGSAKKHMFVRERWTFRRARGAVSAAPDRMLALSCPSCGNPAETTKMGTCTHCEAPIAKGQLQWQGLHARILRRTEVTPPEVGFFAGGDEPSVGFPTLTDPDLAAKIRAFNARHPDFDFPAFQEHARQVFLELQDAWTEGKWERARPHVTDPMYQTLRFWIESYKRHGMKNVLTDVRMTKQMLVKVDLDAWYEALTIRVWGAMKDSVVDASGKVVGGNPKVDRNFSEYWTFLRAAGSGGSAKDASKCPSCGAPLDRVNQTGICGYCEAKITSGRFDWVLSRIDQCETWSG